MRIVFAVLGVAAALHGVAAFQVPTASLNLRSARMGNTGVCRRATPAIFMQATTKPKERTVRSPVFSEVCAETGITFTRYMMELSRENPDLRDLESLMGGIQQVGDRPHYKSGLASCLTHLASPLALGQVADFCSLIARPARPSPTWLIALASLE